jgi:hypothetical protein
LLLACALSSGCVATLPAVRVLGGRSWDGKTREYLGMPVRSGQLVLTESPDATSFVFVLVPKAFHPFTHVAILSLENGEPWVYDITGEVKTFPLRKRLTDNVSGKMYRRSLIEYVAPNLYAEIFDPPPGADGERIAAFARQKYAEGVDFDAYFDFEDHSKLFCSEFVELAIESAGGPRAELEPPNPNPSLIRGLGWLGVAAGNVLPAGRYADPKRFVGALGQFPSRTAAWSYFEAKREIHRRFTVDQRLGFLLSIDGDGAIQVRPEIAAFAADASRLFDEDPDPPRPGDPRIAAAVRQLANERFGAFEHPGSPTLRARAQARFSDWTASLGRAWAPLASCLRDSPQNSTASNRAKPPNSAANGLRVSQNAGFISVACLGDTPLERTP